MLVRPLYPPPMNFVPHPLRRLAQPFVFASAIGLGIWLWLKLGDFSLARCPPDLVWYGGASSDKKCSWPLVVYLTKDIVGAALTGALPVLLCAAVAPVNKATTHASPPSVPAPWHCCTCWSARTACGLPVWSSPWA